MADRFEYAKTRQNIIDTLKVDLMGPMEPDEVLTENPMFAYLVGMLYPQTIATSKEISEQEIESDVAYEDDADYTSGEEDDNEPISVTRFKQQSSIGISFYISNSQSNIDVDVSWGDYIRSSRKEINKDGKEVSKAIFIREQKQSTVHVDFSEFTTSKDYRIDIDSNVWLHVSRIKLKNGYSFITTYLINHRPKEENAVESIMFQVQITAYSSDGYVFLSEDICREVLAPDEFYFKQRPIFGRGRGCAATWGNSVDGKCAYVASDFIPQYEFPGVSAALEGFDKFYFSMSFMAKKSNKVETLEKLNTLANSYENWINETLVNDEKMRDSEFQEIIGNSVIAKCNQSLSRIREGIELIDSDDLTFAAFCFMNRTMILQRSILNYSKKYGSGIACNFKDFLNYEKDDNKFGWRPFQIAFILMNICAIVDPLHENREIVDLLYFPTGGGKTEAYLGIMAFAIGNRRLRANEEDELNKDGGVTAILRYTLRLLTTQQRDRITKMVIAAEFIRKKEEPKFGTEPISIGFWVGGGVTPNNFEELKDNPEKPGEARQKRNLLYKQVLTCPFCGKELNKDNFYIDVAKKSVEIYCSDNHCMFYKYRQNRMPIPIYLVDEEIYSKCPTIILSTVDKFARLPWDEATNSLFGRVDRFCERHGFIAIGKKHEKSHRKNVELPGAHVYPVKSFAPPELIIQDELHLITGPLGTIYGAYETIIEDLCTYKVGDKIIKPKYVVSTATIKNASEQIKCLYGRENTFQFPPNGFEIGDSFFIKEIPVSNDPFRKYVGICASGQSMKTALLRTYSILLQKAYDMSLKDEFKDTIDPYYTLVGYFNSIRELGGTVRLLQDDIPKRIHHIKKKFGYDKERFLNKKNNEEITSRMSSYQIPKKLKELEAKYDSKECLDTAIATNMIAVGMDVDRLGLMAVTGQPKQNSEYIQATSRIGRSFPGLVITLYNPYRPRDLSHYENFTGYHSQLYRFVEGTTATPFSARARDRAMHALIISAIRLKYPELSSNDGAAQIQSLSSDDINDVKNIILKRLNIIKPEAKYEVIDEFDRFIDAWIDLSRKDKTLYYFTQKTKDYNRLMNRYGEYCTNSEKATLNSMREVESSANMYYYSED